MTLNRRKFLTTGASLPVAAMLAGGAAHAKAPLAGTQTAGVHRTRVGNAEVTALLDGHTDVAPGLMSRFDEAQVTAALTDYGHALHDTGIRIPVNGYLINTGDRLVLIDTGAAAMFGATLGNLAANLSAAGVDPADVDTVLLTHLHVDHVGGLLDPAGQAFFPNAELVVAETEWNFWHDDAMMAAGGEGAAPFFQAARMTTAPYGDRLRMFTGETDLGAGLSSVPLPGHAGPYRLYAVIGRRDAAVLGRCHSHDGAAICPA